MVLKQELDNSPVAESFGPTIAYGLIRNLTYLEHAHTVYEMVLVLEGEVTIFSSCYRYIVRPGELAFIASRVVHSHVSKPGTISLIICCHPDEAPQFTRVMQSHYQPVCILRHALHTQALKGAASALLSEENRVDNRVELEGYVNLMLSGIVPQLIQQPAADERELSALGRAIAHIGDMPPPNVQLEDTAQAAGVSKFYLSRLFNEKLEINFNTYVSLLRTNAARRMLVQTEMAIGELAQRCGYANARSLDRDFLRLVGMQPREYRKLYQPENMVDYDTPFIRNLLLERYKLYTEEGQLPVLSSAGGGKRLMII